MGNRKRNEKKKKQKFECEMPRIQCISNASTVGIDICGPMNRARRTMLQCFCEIFHLVFASVW